MGNRFIWPVPPESCGLPPVVSRLQHIRSIIAGHFRPTERPIGPASYIPRDYSKAITLNPTYLRAYLQRCLFYAATDRHALAKADLAKALDIDWRPARGMITHIYPNYLDEIEAERQAKPQ